MPCVNSRDGERQPCELQAWIEFEASAFGLGAVVRNISTWGARLEGVNVARAPDRFDVLISRAAGRVERRPARLAWRRDAAMGVAFLDRPGVTRN